MNNSFPKIDNLEYFSLKVLMHIFAKLGDIDLMNLAEKSYRFENIAKLVINERYTHKYFVVKECAFAPEAYIDLFDRFASEIKQIETKGIYIRNGNHPISSLLNRLTDLKKLKLKLGGFYFHENLLQQHANVTHLSLDIIDDKRTFRGFALPVYHNLKKL